ncbi:uncharacterized protein LOC124115628 [Haliotis rufescens]|uniref:uncharacterized protein LOC124115628 n=1 Tax=Haliotis rufescens TaxID=6454 RepID=UPI00201F4DD6|nr:uncharacterized protein LOC124115628 [Haliotis rufescens]
MPHLRDAAMKLCWFLVLGATMYHCGSCDKRGVSKQLFFVDIVAPPADIRSTMTTLNNTLYGVQGVTVEQAFKVVGEPRVVAILKFQALCDWRPLEEALLAANLKINVKSVYGEMNLAADLKINKDLLERAPEPANIHGEFIYLVHLRLTMGGQTGSSYGEELRNLMVHTLRRRVTGVHYLNYNVLGEFPIQMLYFAVHHPRTVEMTTWRYNNGPLEMTNSVTRIEHLQDYIQNNYCN